LDSVQDLFSRSSRSPARRDQQEQPLPLSEIAIDLRQAATPAFDQHLAAAVHTLQGLPPANGNDPFILDTFKPWRESIIWPFNRLFWQQLADWEAYAKRGFEARCRVADRMRTIRRR
jgi:hypothetical protein